MSDRISTFSIPASGVVPYDRVPGLLEQIPPTDPARLRAIEAAELAQNHYAALGKVAAAWAYFEAVVDTWLSKFANVDSEIAICFTGQMIGPGPRTNAFIALVRHLGAKGKWGDVLDRFGKDASILGMRRNRALHDVWNMDDPAKPTRLEATAKQVVRILEIHEPTEKLLALVEEIDKFREAFDEKIASKIFTELHTSPDIPRP